MIKLLMMITLLFSLSACGIFSGAGNVVESAGDGIGDVVTTTGDAAGNVLHNTEDALSGR